MAGTFTQSRSKREHKGNTPSFRGSRGENPESIVQQLMRKNGFRVRAKWARPGMTVGCGAPALDLNRF